MGSKRWWWLSFTDDDGKFCGACVVDGQDFMDALCMADRRGLNPGGQCSGYELMAIPRQELRYKLMDREQAEKSYEEDWTPV